MTQGSAFQAWRTVPAFRLLVSGQIISQLGDALTEIALMWLVLDLTGSALKMGAVMIAYMVPVILLSLPAGAMVDRWDRRRVMITSDVIRAIVIGTVPVMAAFGWLCFERLLAVSFLMSCVSAFFGPAKTAYVQLIVPHELLLGANGLSQMGWQAAYLVGPALGGIAIGWMGAANVIILDAVSFLLSAAAIWAIRVRKLGFEPSLAPKGHTTGDVIANAASDTAASTAAGAGPNQPSPRKKPFAGMWSDISQGLKFIFQQKAFLYMMVFAWIVNFTAAPMSVLTPLFIKDTLHLGPAAFGFVNAAMSAGMIAGGLGVGSLRSWKRTSLIFGGIIGMGVGFTVFAASQALWQAMGTNAFFGIMNAITNVTFSTLMQEIVPNEKMGRVSAAINAGFMAGSPLSLAMSGFLADNITLRLLYLGMGVVFLASGLVGLRVREFRKFNARCSPSSANPVVVT